MALDLEFGCFGKPGNPPLVILHGLLGSQRNWLTAGQKLSEHLNVFAVDLRNHGISPHNDIHTYDAMIEDLEHWVNTKHLGQFYLLGHSMGGKVAMGYACRHPEKIKALIVEDIAPKSYSQRWSDEFQAMQELDLPSLKSRRDADAALEPKIKDWGMRQFIMTNLTRTPDKGFRWQINLKALSENLNTILGKAIKNGETFQGPTLFIRGTKSDYIDDADKGIIKGFFPNFQLADIPNAGHNVHIDNMPQFIESLVDFVHKVES